MKRKFIYLVSSLFLADAAAAQDAIPVVPVTTGNATSYTTSNTTVKKQNVHHDHGVIPDTLGVTGKVVKTTVGLPFKATKETFKMLF